VDAQCDKLATVAELVASLSHCASTFVYNTMGVRQRVARVCLRQLRLVEQSVALTGRNTTGRPCSVGRPNVRAPGGRLAALQTTTDDDKRQLAKQMANSQ